jgi:hypothetical protein
MFSSVRTVDGFIALRRTWQASVTSGRAFVRRQRPSFGSWRWAASLTSMGHMSTFLYLRGSRVLDSLSSSCLRFLVGGGVAMVELNETQGVKEM